jgi:peptidyl-prolyl cis-trans isomerase D
MDLNYRGFLVILVAAKDRRNERMVMKLLRKRMKIVIWIAATAFVALIFLSWGMDITRRSPGGMLQRGIVGRVNGRPIRIETYREMLRQAFLNVRGEGGAEVDGLTSTLLEDRVFDQIVEEEVLWEEIARRGITTSDAEVLAYIKTVPPPELRSDTSFMTEGQFDVEKYRQIFQNPANLAWLVEYERFARQALPKQKLMLTLYSTARLTDLEIAEAFTEKYATVKLEYLLVTPERALAEVQVSEEEAGAYFEQHAREFELPETAELTYVHFSTAPSASDSASALQDINAIHEELNAGAEFGKLARQVSQDEQTAENGGLLGWIRRGQVVEAFESAAFALRKGQISRPFLSEYGWHVARLNDRKADSIEVSHILVRIRASSETIDRARESATLFREDASEMGFEQAAVSHGVEPLDTRVIPGQREFIPDIGYSNVITDFASTAGPGDISRVLATGLGFYVLELKEKKERRIPPFESLRDTVVALAQAEKRLEQAGVVADSASRLISEGLSVAETARRLDLNHGISADLSLSGMRQQHSVELIGAAALLEEDQVSKPIGTKRGHYIIRVIEKVQPDAESFERLSSTLAGNLIDTKQRRIVNEWMAGLIREAKVVDYRGEMYQ